MKQIIDTTRSLLKNKSSLAIFAGLYALLLAALYGFIATREAKVWQVLLTLIFVAIVPVIFFLLQAAIINSARDARIDWSKALRDSCKLALLALPLILIGWGIAYLLSRWQAHFPTPHLAPLKAPAAGQPIATPPTHWPTVWFATARALIFLIALPLLLIHLWVDLGKQNLITFVRTGARPVLKSLGRTCSRAFAPQSVLIYAAGLIVFALLPYVLLFMHVPLAGNKREFALFILRLVLVFGFTLSGWVVMLSTFARASNDPVLASPAPQETAPTEGDTKTQPSATVAA